MSSSTATDVDGGTGSYGILVQNKLGQTVGASITAGAVWEDRTVFDQSVSLSVDEERSWKGVLKPIEGDDGFAELVVEAELTSGVIHDYDRWKQSNVFVRPGSPNAPKAATIYVTIRTQPLGPDMNVDNRVPAIVASIGPPREATPYSWSDERT